MRREKASRTTARWRRPAQVGTQAMSGARSRSGAGPAPRRRRCGRPGPRLGARGPSRTVANRRARRSPPAHAGKAAGPHRPLGALSWPTWRPSSASSARTLGADPRRPVGLTGGSVDRRDPLGEPRVFYSTAAGAPVLPSMEARARDPEGLAHSLDGEGLVRGHEPEGPNDVPSRLERTGPRPSRGCHAPASAACPPWPGRRGSSRSSSLSIGPAASP